MSEDQNRSYYADRAEQEQEAGDKSADPATAAIHFELAHRYRLLADGIPTLMPPLRELRA